MSYLLHTNLGFAEMLLPIPLLINTLVGLLSVAVLAGAILLLYRAYRRYHLVRELIADRRLRVAETRRGNVAVHDHEDHDLATRASQEALRDRSVWLPFAIGIALLLFTFSGRGLLRLRYHSGADEPKELHSEVVKTVQAPNGAKIHMEIFGRPDAPTLLFTHGWSTDNTEWYYAKRQLAQQFQLVFWDIPGLGASTAPADNDYSLDAMARELNAVVSSLDGKPVVLVGHSIGGMINLTYCRLFPDQVGHQITGIVQVDTSYTNPVTTTKDASMNEALQKPVGEPVLHAMVYLSPLVRAMNWLSYHNGTAQMMNASSAFAGSETWGQLDLISKYGYVSSPAVVARGTLGMFHWDAKPELARITVPVLILVGQQDTTTLPSASVFMQQAISKSSLQSVSPSAHYGLLEQNERYNTAIAQFASASLPGR